MTRRGPVTSWEVDVPLPTPRQSESRARGHIPTQLPGPSCSRTTSSQRARRRLPPGVRPGRPRKGRLVTEGITGPGKEGSGGVSRYREAHPHGDSLTHELGGALHGPGDGGSHLARSRATLQTACIPEASWASWHCCGATKSELRVAGCILYPTAAVLLAGGGGWCPGRSVRPQGHKWPRSVFSWPHSPAFQVSDSTWRQWPKGGGASRRREDGCHDGC